MVRLTVSTSLSIMRGGTTYNKNILNKKDILIETNVLGTSYYGTKAAKILAAFLCAKSAFKCDNRLASTTVISLLALPRQDTGIDIRLLPKVAEILFALSQAELDRDGYSQQR